MGDLNPSGCFRIPLPYEGEPEQLNRPFMGGAGIRPRIPEGVSLQIKCQARKAKK